MQPPVTGNLMARHGVAYALPQLSLCRYMNPCAMSACMRHKPIARGQGAACRPRRNGNSPPCRAMQIFIGVNCGNGPVRYLRHTPGLHPISIGNIQSHGSTPIKRCVVRRLQLKNGCVRLSTAIFIWRIGTTCLQDSEPVHCKDSCYGCSVVTKQVVALQKDAVDEYISQL